jgi:hypothetical protein
VLEDKVSIEAMKQALEALEHEANKGNDNAYQRERDALRTAIAEAEKQEPVSGNYVESPDKRWRIDPVTGNVGIGTQPAAQKEKNT